MRPQLHISLIGATCAVVVLAIGALTPLLDRSDFADVGANIATPTSTAIATLVTAVAAMAVPTQVAAPNPARQTPIADIEPFASPPPPSPVPEAPMPAQPVAAVRGALLLAPTATLLPTAEPTTELTVEIALPASPTSLPTRKPRADRPPRPAGVSRPTIAAQPAATSSTDAATPVATAHSPRNGPQGSSPAEPPAETPTELVEPTAASEPPAETPTELVEPTVAPEVPQPTEAVEPTALPQSPGEPPQPTEEPIGGLIVDRA